MSVVTKDVDLGYKAFLREVEKAKKQPYVKIGFQEEKGNALHPGSMGEKPLTIVQVATFNEFGTKTAPERSFIRSTMDDKRPELVKLTKKLFNQMAAGKMSTERALKILGIKIKALIQRKITTLRQPPNKPRTIRAKKSSNPLIDTGTMRQSVTYKVEVSGAGLKEGFKAK